MNEVYIDEVEIMEFIGEGGMTRVEPIAEQSLILSDVLSELSPEDFTFLVLYYEYGFTQEELAEIENTSKNYVSRKIQSLLELLKERLIEEGLYHV
jgi:RNA polymerase sigma factor (sigma-70 family)